MKRNASFDSALEIIGELKENIQTCCAITMDPDDVEALVDELEDIVIRMKKLVTDQK